MCPTFLGRQWSPHYVLTNIVFLLQVEQLADFGRTLRAEASRNSHVGEPGDFLLTCTTHKYEFWRNVTCFCNWTSSQSMKLCSSSIFNPLQCHRFIYVINGTLSIFHLFQGTPLLRFRIQGPWQKLFKDLSKITTHMLTDTPIHCWSSLHASRWLTSTNSIIK